MTVVSSRLLVFLSAICRLMAPAIARPPFFLSYSCLTKQGYYTGGSTYEANLNLVLSSLSSNTGIDYGFYTSSFGEKPDKVYAIGLCRGDLKPDVCRNCLNFSKDVLLTQLCPNQKEAIALYDECMLRYSNRTIFSTMEDSPEFPWKNDDNVLDDSKVEFHDHLLTLFQNLTDRAAAGGSLRKFAVGNAPAPRFQTIYALVQCTPDLSQQDCNYCLSGALVNFWKDYPWTLGARLVRPSCNFRYEMFGFYNPTFDAPPPGKGIHKSLLIFVASLVALVLLVIIILLSRGRKPMEKPGTKLLRTYSTELTKLVESIPTTISPSSSMVAPTLPTSFESRWDDFLNFRGEDTRKNFIDHLYSALVRVGIQTFRDDKELPRGGTISTELLNAIRGSRICIVVFSKDYASSEWCLDELVEIMGCRKFIGHTLLPIFYHVVPSDVRRQTGTFTEAFVRHEERFRTNMVMAQRWREALTEAAKCSGFDVESIENGHESKVIEKIVEEVLRLKATGRTKSKSGIATNSKSSRKCIPFLKGNQQS